MTSTDDTRPAVPLQHVLTWLIGGFHLWCKAPFKLLVLCVAPLVFEFAVQLIPLVGVLLSKLLTPLVEVGAILGADRLAGGGRIQYRDLGSGFRRKNLLALLRLNLWLLTVFLFDLTAVAVAFGFHIAYAVLLGQMTPDLFVPGLIYVLILPGLLPATALGYAMPLVAIEGLSPEKAVAISLRWSLRSWRAVGMLGLITATLFVTSISLPLNLALIVLAAPLMTAAIYASYRELSGNPLVIQRRALPTTA